MASSTTVALVSKSSFIVALNIFPIWSYSGGGEVVPANPLTAISVIDAQLFSVLPLTVILTNLASIPIGILYFSNDEVVPLLLSENIFVNEMPSSDTEIVKLFCLGLPRYQAISTLHMLFFDPRSACIQEPLPLFDQRVLRLLSMAFTG
jgi:hypothetical protein